MHAVCAVLYNQICIYLQNIMLNLRSALVSSFDCKTYTFTHHLYYPVTFLDKYEKLEVLSPNYYGSLTL